jgi:hypothetical protein
MVMSVLSDLETAGKVVGGFSGFFFAVLVSSNVASGDRPFFLGGCVLMVAGTASGIWVGKALFSFFGASVDPQIKIEFRRREAVRKKIAEAAMLIATVLGVNGRCTGYLLDVSVEKKGRVTSVVVRRSHNGSWPVVFVSEFSEGSSSSSTTTLLKPVESGGYQIYHKNDNYKSPNSLAIKSYIRGSWESHFNDLRLRAEKVLAEQKEEAHRSELRRMQSEREEEKRRFGI